MDDAQVQRGAIGPRWTGRRQVLGRLARLALKELREILRDRRTIVTLVVMPLLLYPLLALVFQRFLITSLSVGGTLEYIVGVDSEWTQMQLARQLEIGDAILRRQSRAARPPRAQPAAPDPTSADATAMLGSAWSQDETDVRPGFEWRLMQANSERRQIVEAAVHLAVKSKHDDSNDDQGLAHPLTWEIFYRSGSPTSEAVLRFVESRLRAFNEAHLDVQLRRMGVAAELPATVTRHAIEFGGAPAFSLAALVPLILVLMTVTGAVYPAIDLTAGERERGTLEALIAAPVPRVGLLLAKYVAVLTVALLTATVNLGGMAITTHSTGLNISLFGGTGLTFLVILKVLVLLGLFAAFFSAVLLAVTSFARSFKEAQAYIIPLMLLCLVPGIICLMPGLEFSGPLAVIPLVNIVLLARDLLEGSVNTALAAAAVFSTLLYVVAAIAIAARIFGTDAILYGGQSTWSDLVRRPATTQFAASTAATMFALAAMFPSYFLLSNRLAREADLSMAGKLIASGLVTALVFGGIPWLVMRYHRVALRTGVGWRSPTAITVVAAGLLGAALWPLAHELFLVNQWLGIWSLQSEQLASVRRLVDEWKQLPWALIVAALAVLPGVFEELFFRGFFWASLRAIMRPAATIVTTAVTFGLFHVVAASVLAPERFLPSAGLGLVLGWLRERSGSVIPCVVLHVIHNGVLLSAAYWRDELAARGFGVAEDTHLPTIWLISAGGITAVAIAMLVVSQRRRNENALPVGRGA